LIEDGGEKMSNTLITTVGPVLNPVVTYDPYVQKAHNEQLSTMSKIVPVASFAFGLIASHLMFGTRSTFVYLFSAQVTFNIIQRYTAFYDEEVEFNNRLLAQMSSLDPEKMQSRLKQLGVTAGQMPSENLKGILARYNIYEENQHYSPSREAGAYTVAMAHLLKLIETPEEQRPIDAFCTPDYKFDPVRGKFIDRGYLFWKAQGLTRSIKTDTTTYDLWTLRYKSPVDLSKEIFGLKAAQSWLSWFSGISTG